MNIQKIPINKLKLAEYNPRKSLKKGDAEYEKLKNSIEMFEIVDPIIVNKDYTVIGGHQRLKVLKDLGYKEVECNVLDLPKDKEKALNIALNKISGEWEFEKLSDILEEIKDFKYETGFDENEILNIVASPEPDVIVDTLPKQEKKGKGKEILCPYCKRSFRK